MPWIVPSSPPGPCSALKTASGAYAPSASTKRSSKSRERARIRVVEGREHALPARDGDLAFRTRAAHHHGDARAAHQTNAPTKCTSSSSSTPNRSATARRTRASKHATSDALAPPRFTMKFACNSETSAAPSRQPFAPTASTSDPPYLPAGCENTSGIRKRERLRRFSADEPALHLFANRGGIRRIECERHARDDRVARERRVPIKILRGDRVLGPLASRASARRRRARTLRTRDRCPRSCGARRRRFREYPQANRFRARRSTPLARRARASRRTRPRERPRARPRVRPRPPQTIRRVATRRRGCRRRPREDWSRCQHEPREFSLEDEPQDRGEFVLAAHRRKRVGRGRRSSTTCRVRAVRRREPRRPRISANRARSLSSRNR